MEVKALPLTDGVRERRIPPTMAARCADRFWSALVILSGISVAGRQVHDAVVAETMLTSSCRRLLQTRKAKRDCPDTIRPDDLVLRISKARQADPRRRLLPVNPVRKSARRPNGSGKTTLSG
jgi:hypothetical protein